MTTPEEIKPEEKDYSLKDVSDNQGKINYLLNHTDVEVIKILKVTVQILKAVKASPSLTHELKGVDFTQIDFTDLDKAISAAEKHSDVVADIRPPGCVNPYPL